MSVSIKQIKENISSLHSDILKAEKKRPNAGSS